MSSLRHIVMKLRLVTDLPPCYETPRVGYIVWEHGGVWPEPKAASYFTATGSSGQPIVTPHCVCQSPPAASQPITALPSMPPSTPLDKPSQARSLPDATGGSEAIRRGASSF